MMVTMKEFSFVILLIVSVVVIGQFDNVAAENADQPTISKMCVPHHLFEACKNLTGRPSEYGVLECVSGRDRMECLELVNKRKADFLVVDPEDMYVAYNLKNEDFLVFSDIRTVEEPEAEFRYEGIILTRKNSDITTLADLRGKKSCHTGFGRNVGYKIPITKLKNAGILKFSTDPSLSPVEKELKGLSELFSSSCLVGTYSPSEEANQLLKKSYSNLCALCEDPAKCNYPDKYSGYDGSIRCLVENGGDVAFTKVIFVRKYFGLSIGNNPPKTEAQANPDDYEYLCEDGSRRPVTGRACSWAQRPWQGYMSNGDVSSRLQNIQNRIKEYYNDGKSYENKDLAGKLLISDKNVIVAKDEHVLPGDHLIKANYLNVIEREGALQNKIRLCVHNEIEQRKCDVLKRAAYSRDIRPEIECILNSNCIAAVGDKKADVVVLPVNDFKEARTNELKPVLYESIDNKNIQIVAVAEADVSNDIVKKSPITFDSSDKHIVDSALLFNKKRNIHSCPLESVENSKISIIYSTDLDKPEYADKELICPDFTKKPKTDAADCNFNTNFPNGLFVRSNLDDIEFLNIDHAFTSLGEKFGHGSKTEDVFELFGEFEPKQRNVLFSDNAAAFVKSNAIVDVDVDLYDDIHCKSL